MSGRATSSFEAVVFDLDGVLTDTAAVHLRAWAETFNAFLAARGGDSREFSRADYLEFVDGKPRYDGVASFLASRQIDLPPGEPSDAPGADSVCALGNRKNVRFNELLESEGVEVLPGAVQLLAELDRRGIPVGVATSSRNARTVLRAAGIPEPLEGLIDGEAAARLGLAGKPAPDTMLAAARELGAAPDRTVLVEDAVAGVRAAVAGGFGLVVGVTRGSADERLRAAGADLLVADLAELDVGRIERWFRDELDEAQWSVERHGLDPAVERHWEALLTVGNGWLATRGAAEEGRTGGLHYPGTSRAGLYNRLESSVAGRAQTHVDMVNLPNWLPVQFRIGDGDWLDLENTETVALRRRLDLRAGVLRRTAVVRDAHGRETRIESRRFVSMASPRLAALTYSVTPLDYAATITLRAGLDGAIQNRGVERYRDLAGRHFRLAADPAEDPADGLPGLGGSGDEIWLAARTVESKVEIAAAARCRFRRAGAAVTAEAAVLEEGPAVFSVGSAALEPGEPLTVEKLATICTSLDPDAGRTQVSDGGAGRDRSAAAVLAAAREALAGAPELDAVEAAHARAWARLWQECDVEVEGDRTAQKLLRLNAYHLLASVGPHHGDLDAGIPARGLHGEAYRGHIFWDEAFVLPFYLLHLPETARAALLYRCRRLGRARAEAAAEGRNGALFPWQSGSDGGEETPTVHLNPASGTWGPDHSRLQRHVSLAIAYNVWLYVRSTGDLRFLADRGAELLVEVARYWADRSLFDPELGRYSIAGVMGPDEFHEGYPGGERAGLTDNAYTNLMAAWLLGAIPALLAGLPADGAAALRARLDLGDTELERWGDITRRLRVPLSGDGVVEQFAGFFELLELDWEGYRARYGSVARLDRLLKAEGDSPDRYQAIKQADALMPFYLLPPAELDRVLGRLGLPPGGELLAASFDYYFPRTSHGSTLSALVHGRLAERLGRRELARRLFQTTLRADYDDVQGGTTGEGIHTGTMAGSHLWVVEDLAGVDVRGECLAIDPRLPDGWRRIACKVRHRGARFGIDLSSKCLEIELLDSPDRRQVEVRGARFTLEPGERLEVALT